ncbi:YggT family protein [Candidatus Izemoplasma sp. B36]|uniref:YggT family protein n=1 Tax=Candidatus Izemoplasma sp. B36 TaxID=3242468 RepID=UPI0035583EF2
MLQFLSINEYMGIFLYYVYQVLRVYSYVIFIYILLSWTPLINSKFYYYLGRICNPYLNIFRGRFVFNNMDFGSLFAIILLQVLVYFIGSSLV